MQPGLVIQRRQVDPPNLQRQLELHCCHLFLGQPGPSGNNQHFSSHPHIRGAMSVSQGESGDLDPRSLPLCLWNKKRKPSIHWCKTPQPVKQAISSSVDSTCSAPDGINSSEMSLFCCSAQGQASGLIDHISGGSASNLKPGNGCTICIMGICIWGTMA